MVDEPQSPTVRAAVEQALELEKRFNEIERQLQLMASDEKLNHERMRTEVTRLTDEVVRINTTIAKVLADESEHRSAHRTLDVQLDKLEASLSEFKIRFADRVKALESSIEFLEGTHKEGQVRMNVFAVEWRAFVVGIGALSGVLGVGRLLGVW